MMYSARWRKSERRKGETNYRNVFTKFACEGEVGEGHVMKIGCD